MLHLGELTLEEALAPVVDRLAARPVRRGEGVDDRKLAFAVRLQDLVELGLAGRAWRLVDLAVALVADLVEYQVEFAEAGAGRHLDDGVPPALLGLQAVRVQPLRTLGLRDQGTEEAVDLRHVVVTGRVEYVRA